MGLLANVSNIRIAAIYPYFLNKKTLGLATVKYAFTDHSRGLAEARSQTSRPAQKLPLLATSWVMLFISDLEYHR